MNHSFSVEIAVVYGIEKAVLLENFYFWIKKNKANKKHLSGDGKVWTYNSAEAFAELFPYIKARKIAEILRDMEKEGLIISKQGNSYDRTKSYTLTDFSLSFFEQSNIQKLDNPLYKNPTMEHTENRQSLNTDINTNINTDINTDNIYSVSKTKKSFIKPTIEDIRAYCKERQNGVNPEQFFDYYESKGWLVGKSKMKDWKASVRTWERNSFSQGQNKSKIQNDEKIIF